MMCYHKRESIGDYRLDEPDWDRFETEPDPDAPLNEDWVSNKDVEWWKSYEDKLIDELWIIGTGKTLKEWKNG